MKVSGPWRPVDKLPPPYVRQRAYSGMVDDLIARWDARLDAGGGGEWGIEVQMDSPVDNRMSGARAELALKTDSDPTHEGLRLRWRWARPMDRWEKKDTLNWRRRQPTRKIGAAIHLILVAFLARKGSLKRQFRGDDKIALCQTDILHSEQGQQTKGVFCD